MFTRKYFNSTFISTPLTFYKNVPVLNKRVMDGVFAESTDVETNPISGTDGS